MKYFLIFVAMIAMVGQGFAQDDVYVTITNGDEVRQITMTQFNQELEAYENDVKVTNGAYTDDAGYLVVPLTKEQMDLQNLQMEQYKQEMESRESRGEGGDFSWSQQWGNDTFGAEAYVNISNGGTGTDLSYSGAAGVKGMIFGNEAKLVEISSNCSAGTGVHGGTAQASGHTTVIFLGQTIYDNDSPKFEKSWTTGDLTIFSYEQVFMVGPIPITLKATLTGRAGFSVALSGCIGGIMGAVRPDADADFAFSAAVGVGGVLSFGVEGELQLIRVEIPASAGVTLASLTSIRVRVKVEYSLKCLSGKVSLFVEIPFKKFKKTIAEWPPVIEYTGTWYDYDHTFEF